MGFSSRLNINTRFQFIPIQHLVVSIRACHGGVFDAILFFGGVSLKAEVSSFY
jgi:hypothetical protein